MNALADAVAKAAKAAKHREWHWCRRRNGFSDLPKWRMVAERLSMPLYQVQAFVNRLEEFANEAGNRGYSRGEVGHLDAEEFGLALGMAADDAARIFAALEDPRVGWIAYGHIADFYERNRDKEDDTAPLRQRRKRARDDSLGALVKLARLGLVAPAVRDDIERGLMLLDDRDLFALKAELSRALSTGAYVTRDIRRDARRDIVTVTPEESTNLEAQPVDNFGGVARGTAEGLSDEAVAAAPSDPQAQAAQQWLDSEGARIVTERLEVNRTRAGQLIERWRDQGLEGDAAALGEVLRACDRADYVGARFHNLVVDGLRQALARKALAPELPLAHKPWLASKRSLAGGGGTS